MASGLLISSQTWGVLLSYGAYTVLILACLVLLVIFKRRTKKQLRPEWVKNRILRAKDYAQKLHSHSVSGLQALLGSTHLLKLKDCVADAAWSAYQIVAEKKDIVFESVANALDGIANFLVKESENGIISKADYEADLQNAIGEIDKVLLKVDAIIAARV